MKAQGRTLLFVSHRFGEVLRLCDRVTIMNDGTTARTIERADLSRSDLIMAVAGDEESNTRRASSAQTRGEPTLRADDLRGRELRGVSLEANKGEILGVIGLAGSGVEELLGIVGGAIQPASGTVTVGQEQRRFATPADAIGAGVAYLPADRTEAALLGISVTTNVLLSRTRDASRGGFLNRAAERRATGSVLGRLRLGQHAAKPLSALSGGNRQRALIARSMFAQAQILVFADPTVGVDFRARAEIHELVRTLAAEGKTVLVSSSEPEEIVMLADRVVVLRNGEVATTLDGDAVSLGSLTRAATH
jgi:ribose transport system ATP-binding protein